MHPADAYAALAKALNATRQWPSSRLTELADCGPMSQCAEIAGEVFEIDISVTWIDSTRSSVLVRGSARGPSHWQLERIDERIEVPVGLE